MNECGAVVGYSLQTDTFFVGGGALSSDCSGVVKRTTHALYSVSCRHNCSVPIAKYDDSLPSHAVFSSSSLAAWIVKLLNEILIGIYNRNSTARLSDSSNGDVVGKMRCVVLYYD